MTLNRPQNGSRPGWLRLAIWSAALAGILLVASGASLWHVDSPGSEATCPICHLAHLPILGGAPAVSLPAPAMLAWLVPAESQAGHAAPAALDSAPRGPPR